MRRAKKSRPTDGAPRCARRPRFEEIEPRILYSADLSPALLDDTPLLPVADYRVLDDAGEYVTLQQDQAHQRDEVVFVDTAVPGYLDLVRDVQREEHDGRRREIILIDAQTDGIEQISSALAERRDVSAVHIVSHGSDGEVQLGKARLDFDSLLRNAGQIKRWGDALAANADLLIYGCDVAATDSGRSLIDALARLTGADVAASEDPTGSRAEGGDWDLEYWAGVLDAPIAVSDGARASWGGLLAGEADATAASASAPAPVTAEAGVASIPLAFQRNDGQTDAGVDFLARGSGYAVWLADGDAVIDLRNDAGGHTIRLGVLGGNVEAAASGENPLAGKSNYLIGAQDQWRRDIDNYAAARYDEVYDGIDLRYYGTQRQLEYDFLLDPGANVGAIRLGFEGVQGVSVADNGELVLDLGDGQSVAFKAPVSYQEGAQGREAVDSRYVVFEDGSVGFEVGAYDAARALVIDPVFSYGTYLGGTGADEILGMAVDSAGNVYLTGYTSSSAFPTTVGAFRTTDLSGVDIFVTKLTPDLSAMVYSTYLGGAGEELGNNIAVDGAGNAYITGYTKSSDFPVMSSYQATLSGSQDAFVTKLNTVGNALVYSTYLGGNGGSDAGYSIAVDSAGSAYVSGYATSANFPTTAGAADTSYNNGEGLVTKFSADGSALLYSTFIGGGNFDAAYSVAVDASGNAVVVGETQSTDFPVTASAYQTTLAGGRDIFVAKLDATGTAFIYSTYLGGNNDDQGLGAAVHASGKIYVTGYTSSNNFDVTAGALQPTDGGSGDAFLSVVDPSASGTASLVYSTYLGGSKNNEQAWAIAVDSAGRAYVAGSTDSDNFPTTSGAYRTTRAGSDDAFLVQINPVGGGAADLLYGTYFGGNNADTALTVAYSNGRLHFGGSTQSNSSIATAGAADTSYNGGTDGFAAVFSFATPPVVTVNVAPLNYTENAGAQPLDTTLTVTDADSATLSGATVRITGNYAGGGEDILAFTSQGGITGVFSAGSGILTLTGTSSVANYQAALRSVTYTNTNQKPSTLTRAITITTNDGTLASAPVVRQVNVISINDVPSIVVPGAQLVNEDSTLTFSSTTSNAIAVDDPDAGTSDVQVTLNVSNGTLTLFQTTGLTFLTGTGTGNPSMSFRGTISNINAALNGLRFDPTANYNGTANLVVIMNDLGNTGSPGAHMLSRTIGVSVAAVNDAPVNAVPGPQSTQQNTQLVFSAVTGNAITVGDVDAGAGELRVTLTATNGIATLATVSGLSSVSGNGTASIMMIGTLPSLNGALNGLVFTPGLNYSGPASLTITTDDQGNAGSGSALTDVDTVAIIVSPNVAPIIVVSGAPLDYDENDPRTPVDAALTVGDPDNATLDHAIVRIAGGYVNGEDVLDFTDQPGIVGIWDPASGTLTLTGVATRADYQTALRTVTYENFSDNPSTAPRDVSFVVNDGIADSAIAVRSLGVNAANDAPLVLVPVGQAVNEDSFLLFSTAYGNEIVVDDPDAGTGAMQVTVTASNGVVTLSQITGLTLLAGADGSSSMTFTGAIDDVNAALNGLRFDPAANFTGPATLDVAVDDGALTDSASVSIDVASVNDAPRGLGIVVQTMEDTAYVFSPDDFGFSDPDDTPADELLTIKITTLPGGGTLTDNGVAVTAGDFISAADILVGRLRFTPTQNANAAPYSTLGFQVQDDGGTASGGSNLDPTERVLTIDVLPENDAPMNLVPSGQATAEDMPLVFALANGNAIRVTDVDENGGQLNVTLTAVNGTLTLGGTTGLTSVVGNGTSSVAFTGGLAELNAALEGLAFTPTADFAGVASLGITTDDQGNSGAGMPLADSDTVSIDVTPVNDAPTVSAITDQTIDHDTSLPPVPFTVGDNESSPGALVVTATSSNQTLVPNSNLVIGGSGANRTIALTPAAGQWGAATITVSVSDGGSITTQSFVLTVNPDNLPPAVVNGTFTVPENTANGTAVGTVTATDPDPQDSFSKIYWADYFSNSILRANLDGSGSETLVAGLSDPVAVAVDHVHGKIYWADSGSNKIQRANLDGTNVQDVVASGLSYPLSIEVDPDGGKIYWVDNTTRKIQRANLDGTGIQDVAVGLSSPTAIDLDLIAGKIYWVDDGTDRVQRANLDGSGLETLVTGLNNPKSIGVDVSNGNMYWVDLGILTSRIGTANLDGSGAVFDFIPVSNGTNGLAVDSSRGQLYWTENDLNNRIRRANLDGTGVTTVLSTGLPLLSDPAGIALGPAMQGLSYAIVGGNTGGAFAIDAKTGALTVANGSVLNLEATPSYALLIQVQDAGGMSTTAPVTVNLVNVNEPPSAITPGSVAVDEGIDTSAGYTVATLATTDVDAGDVHTYSIVGGADAAKFSIAGDQLRIADGILDYETKPSYQVTVRSTDSGGLTVDQTVAVTVLDVNEAPAVSAMPNLTITEDGAIAIAFVVGDPETAAGSLTLTAISSDPTLIPNGNLVFGGSGANRSIIVTPAPNAYGGPVTVTVSVSDGVNITLETFDLTLAPVADHLLGVDTAADVTDGDTSSIDTLLMNKGTDGFISLREAITAANNSVNDTGGPDRIHFNIPGAGLHTIDVLSALPTISDAVVIDGTSEPGFAGAPVIELNGALTGGAANGLHITAGDSTVRGLVINRFGGSGIFASGGGNNTIQGNYIGVDSAGNADLGNGAYGIRLASSSNLVGGTAAGDRNVISGNDIDGIYVAGSSGNVIQGNYIGTNAAGTGAVRNEEDGIWLEDASNNTIGGTTPGARNVISGNAWSGIALSGGGTGNVVQGNYIGVDASGVAALSNSRRGIDLYGAADTLIGGTTAGAGNVIAHNTQTGVVIAAGTGHTVLGNAIYSNGGLGIDIDDDGVSTNDTGDGDLGTNLQMNAPVVYIAMIGGGNLTVLGEARPGATVEFFKAAADPSGYGEGQTFIGSAVVSGATPGLVDPTASRFSYTFTAGSFGVGDRITATATDSGGNTSEFSLNIVASVLGPGVIVVPSSGLTTTEDGGSATFSVMLSTQPTADVTISLFSSDTTEGTVVPASLTFTTANWDVAQTVAVTGVPDAFSDGSVAYTIVLSAAVSADPGYQGIDPVDVAVTNLEVNNAPVPSGIAGVSVAEDSANTVVDLFSAFADAEDADSAMTYSVVANTNPVLLAGAVVDSLAGTLTLAYAPDVSGTADITVRATDTGGAFAETTFTVTVAPVNDAPVAGADAEATAEDSAVTTGDVLINDADVDGDTLAVSAFDATSAAGGSVVYNGNGTFTYTPAAGFNGADTFTYTVSDGNGGIATTTVSISVAPVVDAPATGSDAYSTAEDATLTVAGPGVLANDTDQDGNALSAVLVSGPVHGTLVLNADGSFTYSPGADFHGADSFAYQATDGTLDSAVITVSLTVNAVNDLPLVTSRTKTGLEDVSVALSATDFIGAFSDVDGDSLARIQIVSLPVNATLMLSGAPVALNDVVPAARLGDLVLVPNADWAGTTRLSWLAYDGTGYSAVSADIVLSVTAVNDAPVLAVNGGGTVSAGNTLVLGDALLRADDPDDAAAQIVFTVTAAPVDGSLTLSGSVLAVGDTFTQDDVANGRLSYGHAGATAGPDGFSFTVADAGGASAGSANFNISIVLPPPPPPAVIIPVTTAPAPAPVPVGTGSGTSDSGEPAPSSEGSSEASDAAAAPASDAPAADPLAAALLNAPSSHLAPVASPLLIDASAPRVYFGQLAVESGGMQTLTSGAGGTTAVAAQADVHEVNVSPLNMAGSDVQRVQIASLETMTRTLTNAAWVGELDVMREQIGGKIQVESTLVASSVAVSGGLSVGYVIWLLRGGLLVSSLLSSLPAWHAVDPMPVLARSRNSDDEKDAEEDPLERLFGRAKDALLGGFGGRRAAEPAPAATRTENDQTRDATTEAST